MTPERWAEIRDLLDQAMQLEPSERPVFLNRCCSHDAGLRAQVEELLLTARQVRTGFLESTPWEHTGGLPLSAALAESGSMIGQRVGSYRIVEEIGVGGMGVVYRAFRADDQYDKQVAIKVMQRGPDSQAINERFKTERQILASLDHPNIARLLDGGTTETGQPFFVMELIEGLPIDQHCDRRRLTIAERLELFCQVCCAVQHAHRHLIVHRDIKPGNILVTSEGVPKLLDFGIAKILDPMANGQQQATITQHRALTPNYASPEQVTGRTITTASDVYSLGVVLYELLSGRSPYRSATHTPHEIARQVCEADPDRPSAAVRHPITGQGSQATTTITPAELARSRQSSPDKLGKWLRGDLDNIVLMALRKEPQRRYASAERLREDIRRYLNDLPVSASRGTAQYRMSKFISRHKTGVAVAGLVAVAFLAVILAIVYEAHVATGQRALAERRLREARQLTESLLFELPVAIDNGPTSATALVSRKGIEYLNEVASDVGVDPRLSLDVALGYVTLAQAHGHPAYAHTGDSNLAVDEYQRATSLLEKQFAKDPNNKKLRFFLARAHTDKALSLLGRDVAGSVELYGKALALLPDVGFEPAHSLARLPSDYTVLSDDHVEPYIARARWINYELLGEQYGSPYYANLGDTSKAQQNLTQAIQLAKRAYDIDPAAQNVYHLYYSYVAMAGVLWARGDLKGALKYQNQGEALFDGENSSVGREDDPLEPSVPYSQSMRDERAVGMIRRANLLVEAGRLGEADAALRQSREILEKLFWLDARNGAARRDLTRNYNLSGLLLLKRGNVRESVRWYHHAEQLGEESLAARPDQPEVRHRLADTYQGLCDVLAAENQSTEGLQYCTKALEIREFLARLDPNDARYKRTLATTYSSLGGVLKGKGEWKLAMGEFGRAQAIQSALAQGDPSNALVARELAHTKEAIARFGGDHPGTSRGDWMANLARSQ